MSIKNIKKTIFMTALLTAAAVTLLTLSGCGAGDTSDNAEDGITDHDSNVSGYYESSQFIEDMPMEESFDDLGEDIGEGASIVGSNIAEGVSDIRSNIEEGADDLFGGDEDKSSSAESGGSQTESSK